jgi:hypothetical protein
MKENLTCLRSHAAGNVRRVEPSLFASENFVVTECGAPATDKYVALRRSGLTENQAFGRAFGTVFSGEAETVLKAAQAFESTKLYARQLKELA